MSTGNIITLSLIVTSCIKSRRSASHEAGRLVTATGTIKIIYNGANKRVAHLVEHIDAKLYAIVRTCGIGNNNS